MEVRAIRNKAAGSVEVARGVQKAQEAALEDFPGPVDSRNAAVAFATRAGGARETDERAGGARKILGVDETREENAAVLEKLEKNGAFATLAGEGGVADKTR